MATARVSFAGYHLAFTPTFPFSNPEYAPSIVGTDPWGDDDSATYTEAAISERDDVTYADYAFAVPVAPAGMTALNSYSLAADLTATNIGGTGTGHSAVIFLYDTDENQIDDFGVISGLPDGTLTTFTESSGAHLAALESVLLNGGWLAVLRQTNLGVYSPPADYVLRTHRLNLTIDYEGTAPEPSVGVQPRRIFQRSL